MGKLRNQELLDRIGVELKRIRAGKNLSQEEVYNDTGVHIARIELGQINLTVSTLLVLCEYYQVSPGTILQSGPSK